MDAFKTLTEGMIKENQPKFEIGDTVRVSVRIKEGDKERIQAFEGTVIAKKHGGIAETFTVRRTSYGVGVGQQPVRGEGRGRSPRQGPPCEALLPARTHRQGCQGQGSHLSTRRRGGRRIVLPFSVLYGRTA